MGFCEYVNMFAGLPIREYQQGEAITESDVAHRVALGAEVYYDDGFKSSADEFYAEFFNAEGLENVKVLVFGCWNFEGDGAVTMITDLLVKNAAKLPNLKALFLGDVISEDCEVSWLEMGDISKLWKAFPQLETLWIRGGEGLSFGEMSLPNLKELVVQTGGLPKKVVREILAADLPNLEHLELWLGDEGYGADTEVNDFSQLLAGSLFPKLKYLGLCNSQYSDALAKALAEVPIMDRIETLDLSNGTLGDEGAEALLASGKLAKLKKLDVHYNYLSCEIETRLGELPCDVDTNYQRKEDEYGRYVAVGE